MQEIIYTIYYGKPEDFGTENFSEENIYDQYETEAEAVAEARQLQGPVFVEKALFEVDDVGMHPVEDDKLGEIIYVSEGNASEEAVEEEDPDELHQDFPKADIEDIDEIDDAEYAEMARQYEEDPADWIDDNKLMKEAVEALEENESEVECKGCFDLFPKEDCIKTEQGYMCPKCHQEMASHQGTNLDLIDADPFDLSYEDPRDPEEEEEPEIKDEPVDENELRKHEAGIEEAVEEEATKDEDKEELPEVEFTTEEVKEVAEEVAEKMIDNIETKGLNIDTKEWKEDATNIVAEKVDEKVEADENSEEDLEEHINDRPADIESDQKLQGADNAVVDCETDQKLIAHSEDEKPLDCKMKKPALKEPLAGEEVDIKVNEDLSEEEAKELDKEVETLEEELKVIIDFSEYKPWSGAVDTYNLIKDADKLDELESYLEDIYPDGITATQINDILWFDSDQVLSYLGLGDAEDDEVDESLKEAKKDDELPVDPEAAKLEVHTMLNDLVADEIEAINGYEEAKKEILDTPIAHKDNILDTIDHVEDEEKEHVDELIDATTEIPFDKEESPAPVAEEPVQEPVVEEEPMVEEGYEDPFGQDFPKNEEKPLVEVAAPTPFDSDVKVGDKIRIGHLEGEGSEYDGKEGTVDHIDSIGQLHGTWGGLAIIPGVDDFDIITEELSEKKLKLYDIFDDGEYVGQIKAVDEEDAVNQCYNGAFGRSSSDNLFTAELAECLKEAKAKPEADKEKTYNDGLKLAKLHNKPVIYGYTNKSYGGKFFALDDPIVCNSVSDETKKFKQQYKSCGQVYVAYPDKDFAESLKLSEGLDLEDDKLEVFTPEEQEEYNCDENGEALDGYDQFHHCGWCGEIYPETEMRREVDFGWICSRCEAALKSQGGPLMFIENKELDK